VVKDPEHVHRLFAQEPGDPTTDLDGWLCRSAL